jgi:dienelactone hydrolase
VIAADDSVSGKRPGVVVVPEWWGLNDYAKRRAQEVAGLGYVALAADIYGNGVVAATPQEAGQLAGKFKSDRALLRQRAQAAVDALRKDPRVDASKIAVIGYCFGGTTALEVARSGADVAGVVSIHGGLDSLHPEEAKNIKAKVLVLHGAADGTIPPDQIAAFEKELEQGGVDWQMITYGHAKHGFTNPDADKLNMPPVGYNAAADKRSWEDMKAFFAEIFAK